MILTFGQIHSLGTSNEFLEKAGLKRHNTFLPERASLFSCKDYTVSVQKGYQRYIGWSQREIGEVKDMVVKLEADGNGFHPTVASHMIIFTFDCPLQEWYDEHIQHMGTYIHCNLSPNRTILILSSKDQDKEIIEVDIFSHNNGVKINVLRQKEDILSSL